MSHGVSKEELDLLSARATPILEDLGLGDAFRFDRLSGGRNNRVYRVTGRHEAVVLKWYFRSVEDERDRLNSEYSFYEYAMRSGVTCVAAPLRRDSRFQLAVFSLLEGQRVASGQVESSHVEQAIDFIRSLNEQHMWSFSAGLPAASEACFSIQEHIDCISARVARLRGISTDTEHHHQALELAATTIAPALATSVRRLQSWAGDSGVDLPAPLRTNQKCISPSDFGFHNALISADGQLKFFDFEYAGWDDPAKLLCDFYCQPEIPAPRETWRQFADLTAALGGDTELERQRQALLFPLYQVKWCCILLNEFVATARDRREFAEQKPADLALQLEKAKRLADQLQS